MERKYTLSLDDDLEEDNGAAHAAFLLAYIYHRNAPTVKFYINAHK